MVSRLIFDYDIQVLGQFCLLLLCVVVPFVVQVWGIISESVRKRFLSWVMLLTAIFVIVLAYVSWILVSVLSQLIVMMFVVDAFRFLVGLVVGMAQAAYQRYLIVDSLSRFFLRNLHSQRRRKQIPRNSSTFKREAFLIGIFYYLVSVFVVGLLLG